MFSFTNPSAGWPLFAVAGLTKALPPLFRNQARTSTCKVRSVCRRT